MTLQELIAELRRDFRLPEGLCFLLGLMQRVEAPRGAMLADHMVRPRGVYFLMEGSVRVAYAGEEEVGFFMLGPGAGPV